MRRLVMKSLHRCGIVRLVGAQNLERDRPIEPPIARSKDGAHSARPDAPFDHKVRQFDAGDAKFRVGVNGLGDLWEQSAPNAGIGKLSR